jgi:glycosyltransferase involved in cell wall biosynthesis
MHYWYNFKLPAILKKYNVSAFITETAVACLRTKVPQCVFLKDISFLQGQKEATTEYSFYIKKFFSRFIHRAAAVLVSENFMMTNLLLKYPSSQQKILFAGHGLNELYQPIQPGTRESQLNRYTEGYEYFACECTVHNAQHLVTLLKAYSIFKKRLKSNMRLLFLLRGITKEACIKDFKNYKYRSEVVFLADQPEEAVASLVAAAFAFIQLPPRLISGSAGLNALQCGVPLLTFHEPGTEDLYGDAALYALKNEKSLADNMMLLYKDETAKKDYIKKGHTLAAGYNWPDTAHRVWQTILSISRD